MLKTTKMEKWKWLSSSVAKQRGDAAKTYAFTEFKKRFPSTDESRFIAQVDFDSNRKTTARVLFPDDDGSWKVPLIEDRKDWSQALKDALGMHQDGGFPAQLSLAVQKTPKSQSQLLIFLKKIEPSTMIGDVLNNEDLRYSNRVFHHQVQRDFYKDTDQVHNLRICKKVAFRA